jgi:hypothetical protein
MTTGGSMRYSLDEVLSGMLASLEGDEFPDDPAEVAAAFEGLAAEFPMFAPMAAGVDPEAVADALKSMEAKAILKRGEGKYILTAEGRAQCVSSKRTLFNRRDVEQLEAAAKVFSA